MLNEPVAVTMLVINALNALEIPYFIGGSLASSVHGVIRTTMDVDHGSKRTGLWRCGQPRGPFLVLPFLSEYHPSSTFEG